MVVSARSSRDLAVALLELLPLPVCLALERAELRHRLGDLTERGTLVLGEEVTDEHRRVATRLTGERVRERLAVDEQRELDALDARRRRARDELRDLRCGARNGSGVEARAFLRAEPLLRAHVGP